MQSFETEKGGGFRPELEGLRGVAILLVLLFHAGIPLFDGGFVGVDVFYVLSGFLITGLLLREHERAGTISLRDFYARRARRILPAAAVVLVLIVVASWFLVPPLQMPSVSGDATAAALSVANIRFAVQATDYFSNIAPPSPVLHYWSLSVEEQFYLLWPALLLLTLRLSRSRVSAGVLLISILVVSLVLSIVLTTVSQPWAFYSLPTRAWQLSLGGLLAVVSFADLGRLGRFVLPVCGWVGLIGVVASALIIDTSTPYPGVAAILPTGSTALFIASARAPGSPAFILAVAPLRFLGRISYSLYLVHWPILVLPAAGLALGEELPLWERLALAAISIPVAWVSWRFVEQPFHRGARLRLPARSVVALGLAAIIASAGFSASVGVYAEAQLDEPAGPGPIGNIVPTPSLPVVGETNPASSPALGSPGPDRTPKPGSTPRPVPTPVVNTGALPRGVKPALSDAPNDWEQIFKDNCELQYNGSNPPSGCVYGNPDGQTTVALVGDSTAGEWFPALQKIALQRDWKLVPFVKFSCRFEDIPQYSRILKREYTECEQWIPNVVADLKQLKPDLTIVSADRSPGVVNPSDDNPAVQGAAMARLLAQVPGKVAIMVVTPQLTQGSGFLDPPTCLSEHRDDVGACEASRSLSYGWRYGIEEKAAYRALKPRATIINLSDWICPGSTCPAVMNNMIVWRDYFHLTATFAASLADALAAQLPPLGP
jgi:peptidoglycan/LPS O-acetylase OafA/YrhL